MDTDSKKEIEEIDYKVGPRILGKIGAIFAAIFALTFLLNFPILGMIETKVRDALSSNRACPITFDKMDISFFLPEIILDHVNISGKCINKKNDIVMSKITSSINGPSFSPLGVSTQTNFDFLSNNVEILFSQGIGSSVLKLNNQVIKLHTLRDISEMVNLKGNLDINTLIELKDFVVKSGNIFLKSKNLAIGSMNISGFNTPSLDIKHFSLKGQITKGVLNITELIIGNKNSPIRASFKGKIIINNRNIMVSKMDLKGEIQFSKDLREKLFFIDQFLKSYNKKDNFYLIQLKGTLSYAVPSTY
jgi:type II secretion system protein N